MYCRGRNARKRVCGLMSFHWTENKWRVEFEAWHLIDSCWDYAVCVTWLKILSRNIRELDIHPSSQRMAEAGAVCLPCQRHQLHWDMARDTMSSHPCSQQGHWRSSFSPGVFELPWMTFIFSRNLTKFLAIGKIQQQKINRNLLFLLLDLVCHTYRWGMCFPYMLLQFRSACPIGSHLWKSFISAHKVCKE